MNGETTRKLKPVRLELPPEEHEILRKLAKFRGKTMAAYVRWLVKLRIGRFLKGDEDHRVRPRRRDQKGRFQRGAKEAEG